MPTSQVTIVAKVWVNTLAAAGICEKDDTNSYDGFEFGWDNSGALRLTVEKWDQSMRVVGNEAAAHLFINGVEQAKPYASDGNGTLGYTHATNQPFSNRERQLRSHERIVQWEGGVPGSIQGPDPDHCRDDPVVLAPADKIRL